MRWLLGAFGDDGQIFLIAQALPCSMAVIEANAALRNDHTRGIMAAKFRVAYEEFDGERASGKNTPVRKFLQCHVQLTDKTQ